MTSRVGSAVYRLHAGVGAGDRVADGREVSVWLEEQPTSSTTHAVSAATNAISRLAGDIVTICTCRRSQNMPGGQRRAEPLADTLRTNGTLTIAPAPR